MLKGCERRETRAYELTLFGAWQTARLSGQSKLKALSHYLAELKPPKGQRPAEMIATLQQLRARGAPMTITRIDKHGG